MIRKLKTALVAFLRKCLPQRCKSFLFRASFAVMDEAQQYDFRQRCGMASMEWSLRNLARLGFQPEVILDVGAYEGEWTQLAGSVFPSARILMVEAQTGKEAQLAGIAAASGGRIASRIALLGSDAREAVDFYEMELGSSVLRERCNVPSRKVIRPMTTLDAVVRETGMERVDFLKLDVQGYELEVLSGGPQTLAQAEVVLLEVSLLEVIEGAPLMPRVLDYMKERGFAPYDVCTLMRRPLDRALCQVDMIFVREQSRLLADKSKGE